MMTPPDPSTTSPAPTGPNTAGPNTAGPNTAGPNSTGLNLPRAPRPRWFTRPWVVLLASALLALAVVPFDGMIEASLRPLRDGPHRLGGDVRRTLEFLQQFGDLASSLVIGIACLLLDPRVRRRLLDWALAAGAVALATKALKIAIGRPRPRFEDPTGFVGLWRTYSIPRDGGETLVRYSWELWKGSSSDLASMPSSHTSAAAALAVVLARLYPPLTPLVISLVAIVASARCILGAHYASDVILGAGVGYAVARWVFDAAWSHRLATTPHA